MVISLWYLYSLGLKVAKAAITVISSAYLGLPHLEFCTLTKWPRPTSKLVLLFQYRLQGK